MKPQMHSDRIWLEGQAPRRQRYLAHFPRWRKPLWGYLLALPLIALSMLIPLLFDLVGIQNVFVGAPFFLVTVFVAWIWGIGPAIVDIVLCILVIDFFFIPPRGSLQWNWPAELTLVPFLLAQLLVAWITTQLESARQQALLAQQELEERASELEQVNQKLEEANQTKERFLSMASHELKTPLTTIRTEVQFGLRRLAKQKEGLIAVAAMREILEQVNQQTRHLQRLVNDILDLSILGTKLIPLRVERYDLSAQCREIIEKQQVISGRSIVLQAPPTPVLLDADCERIGQVMINLITNAIKYSCEESTVLISICQSDADATVQVHNYGQPIPAQQQEHLFEPYYRTPNARASPKQGWGLGLAISKEIAEQHKGRIWVESSQEQGTTFFVQVPLKAAPS